MRDTSKCALWLAVGAMAAVITVAAPAKATTLIFTGTLLGASENPPNGSPATGSITVTLNDVTDMLSVSETFSGLTVPASAAHIHCCAALGTNAPIVLNFVGNGFPTGVTAGSFTHTFDLTTDLAGITVAAFISNLEAGLAYANIHNANFPAGEIRGQLLSTVPLPATLPLFVTGLSALGLLGWRKKQKRAASV